MSEATATDPPRPKGRVWGYAGAILGGLISIAANVAHSFVPPAGVPAAWRPPVGDVVAAVFWPVALFFAIEILTRTPWPDGKRWLAVRLAGLLPVALVAALVSYNHLSALLADYRESALTSHLGPFAVDGLMVMASAAVMATAPGRETAFMSADMAVIPAAPADAAPDTSADTEVANARRSRRTLPRASRQTRARTPRRLRNGHRDRAGHERGHRGGQAPDTTADTETVKLRTQRRTSKRTSRSDTAAKVAALVDEFPDMSTADMAERLGVSDRTVRRHLAANGQNARSAPG